MFDNFSKQDKIQKHEIQKQLSERQQLYMRVFNTLDGEAVLEDLALRCFNKITTYDDMPHKMAFNEGRRSIYAHIVNLINRDISEIVKELTNG